MRGYRFFGGWSETPPTAVCNFFLLVDLPRALQQFGSAPEIPVRTPFWMYETAPSESWIRACSLYMNQAYSTCIDLIYVLYENAGILSICSIKAASTLCRYTDQMKHEVHGRSMIWGGDSPKSANVSAVGIRQIYTFRVTEQPKTFWSKQPKKETLDTPLINAIEVSSQSIKNMHPYRTQSLYGI